MFSKSKIELKKEFSQEAYKVTQEGVTEAPFTGKYLNHRDKGMYKCVVCGTELFSSGAKFDSGTGWPSFTEPANLNNVELKEDLSHHVRRTEVVCRHCGAHLGHVFPDGPKEAGGNRYCVNSCALGFEKKN
ncbi:MAG: Peptide methionine sulfoxide reductase MsrB [Parcubacteria group bacterium GW2011_GWA2_47_21]|uniref:peptide-methionine (R)-S-oxide reductase n=2 Tax=Parcubacteria group TaxID=1794811 RepID=A0A0G0GBR5_9BACT|nr:MAG: Peptide methionine sulfoxide reductase MsrB [Candidatus Nomurabacteria bacterium GW2011_GWA1_36_15]KKS24928.1 MAG: Peptide methionine sulfoxide reductase MsrB [Candidatus Yanofskybacteria bacterium GW2011_GWC2_41_9]KKU70514.1 MAG: Peptide methionine sulfoxide reductase MsrB [Parcubacteria group bacterium GW2011_GWA2_47_21]